MKVLVITGRLSSGPSQVHIQYGKQLKDLIDQSHECDYAMGIRFDPTKQKWQWEDMDGNEHDFQPESYRVVFLHRGNANANQFETEFSAQIDLVVFSGAPEPGEVHEDTLKDKVLDFLNELQRTNDFQSALNLLLIYHIEQRFSSLKHSIDHIFLPTVIDLQGIDEESREGGKANEYLKEVFEMRINSDFEKDKSGEEYFYYRNRLNRARYLTIGNALVDILTGHEKQAIEYWKDTVEAKLPDGQSMHNLVEIALGKADEQRKQDITERWKKVYKLLGLCYDEASKQFNLYDASPIRTYMEKMDKEWLGKCEVRIEKDGKRLVTPLPVDAKTVLSFFENNKDWGIEGLNINSFGDWFSELDDAMDKLKESFPPIDVESM